MAEPLKNLLHPALVKTMADQIGAHSTGFDTQRFTDLATEDMQQLELMQRAIQIRDALAATLPQDFEQAAALLSASLPKDGRSGMTGWALLPVSQFVAQKGLGHFDLSLSLLKQLTPHFTAEFGIRPFIHAEQDRALATIGTWTQDANHHVRRLASEGTRPRLPWAIRLPSLMRDPQPILRILTALLGRPGRLRAPFRRKQSQRYRQGSSRSGRSLCRRAYRRGFATTPPAAAPCLTHAFEEGPCGRPCQFRLCTALRHCCHAFNRNRTCEFGGALAFTMTIVNQGAAAQKVMIDYAVHHRKANGSLAPKVFKWKSLELAPGERVTMTRQHAMRAITTRQYYPGGHRLDILVNGAVLAGADFQLVMA